MREKMKGIHVVFRVFILSFLLLGAVCVIPNCTIQSDNNTQREIITLTEKSHADLSYELPTQIQEKFLLEVKLCESNTFRTACTCRGKSNNTNCKNQLNESTCEAGISSVTFGLNVTRTHSDVVWQLLENSGAVVVAKHSKLQVSYPPEITNISVKGDTINGSYITNERQKVQISCLFTNGNPPSRVTLISDTTGKNVSSAQPGEGSLQLSLGTISCHDVWPSIGCEAPGSELNQSVLILVRCLPQLSCECSEVDPTFLETGLTFGLKSYTRNITKCELTRLSPGPGTTREVPCDIKGSIPELSLTLRADGASRAWSWGGTWMLHILSEQGNSNITFTLVNNTIRSNIATDAEKKENDLLVIMACTVSLIVLGLALFLFCIVRTKQRGCGGHERMFMSSEGVDRSNRAAEQETPRHDANEPFGRAPASCSCPAEPKQTCWRQARSPGRKNAEGLIYGELDFSDRTASDVIHGALPETEYAEINFAAAIRSSSD